MKLGSDPDLIYLRFWRIKLILLHLVLWHRFVWYLSENYSLGWK
jgi:hypothetical protein